MNDLQFLNARTSIRDYDAEYVISDRELYLILQSARNAPSSNNFQPWKVFVIKNKKKQAVLKKFSANQKQVLDASAVFLIFGNQSLYDIEDLIQYEQRVRHLSAAQVEARKKRIQLYFDMHPEDRKKEGLKLDCGLFSMNLMHVIRAFGYDSVPMRGVDFEKVQEYFAISKELIPILMLPVGKSIKKGHPHIRKGIHQFAEIIH
ncbi:nitroreductase family protein [Vagococcus entomophilus]|uniref:Nitroreductase family protein n=1 Tax=Vagococcus entomophilus TaxID=1160095 RepID=A0A430AGP8_9ENTE|nr:nitroreductase family protein [Vagococcus entomophilus]RSU07092.1 nitroreductase family protein [Vagococcus entomophilus]